MRTARVEDFTPLVDTLERLEGLDVRVGGGWGIDVLAGRVTRRHHDIDLFVPAPEMAVAAERLRRHGLDTLVDEGSCRMVLEDRRGNRVDLHGVAYRSDGHGVQRHAGGDAELFPAWGWARRSLAGRPVVCLSAEAQRFKHRGYPERPHDAADLAAIADIREPSGFDPAVRTVEAGEEDLLPAIEAASDRLLRPLGIWPLPAPGPAAQAATGAPTMVTLVAARPPVGFARIERVDGHPHLGQLSVLPEYGCIGIGTALVEAACWWSRQQGAEVLTLTTFVDVPFNAPFYRRLGFRDLERSEVGPQLAGLIDGEAELERFGPRTVMARSVGDGGGPAARVGLLEQDQQDQR